MPDADIPKNCEGEYSLIAFLLGESGATVMIPEADYDSDRFVRDICLQYGRTVTIIAEIHGLSLDAVVYMNSASNPIFARRCVTRESLLQLLTTGDQN